MGHRMTGEVSVARGATAVIVLGLACAAQFMVVLDVSVVNVALPSIQTTLGFDPVDLQWVASGYALVFAGFLLLGGRLADLYGVRRIVVLGLAVFSAASLVGGAAGSPGWLIAARAVQGLGAAVLAPATLTMLTTTFPEGPPRTRALAVWTAVSLVGGAAGNLVGGALTEFLGWRWILLINVPIGAVAILAAIRSLPAWRRERTRRLDLPGAMLATVGLAALTYAVTHAQTAGWGDPATVGVLIGGLAALAVFGVVEARVRARSAAAATTAPGTSGGVG
jgi:MFS family permease